MEFLQTPLPMAEWVELFTKWLTNTFEGFFGVIQQGGSLIMNGMAETLLLIPPLVFIALLAAVTYYVSNRKIGLMIFAIIGPLFVLNQGLWGDLINTLTLVIVATLISVILGVPLGIWMSKSERARDLLTPILDFMQTMPAFVYLIPAVAFFGIGMVPGVFASVIFALPPTVRLSNLGIRQVPRDLIEASESFGSTGWQKLSKLELPLAKQTIFAGINQTTMLALSMVVTASMIGAPGLGEGVLQAVQRAEVGNGFVTGTALVILAIIIDRLTQNINKTVRSADPAKVRAKRRMTLAGTLAAVLFLVGGTTYFAFSSGKSNVVTLSSVQWDSEIASAHVVKAVLEDLGYTVEITNLDPTLMWSAVATGDADATVAPWLPTTHNFLYEEYGDQMDDLGPNLDGARNGVVVPAYMDVESVADLRNEASKTITGVEPGAGVTVMGKKLLEDYDNLSDWTLTTSSTGAMLSQMDQAIANGEDFLTTGWAPHWMFERYDLKFIEDPMETMGTTEQVMTFARMGLKEDMPEVYKVLDNFYWTVENMQAVMMELQDVDPEIAARNWIDANPEKVASWIE